MKYTYLHNEKNHLFSLFVDCCLFVYCSVVSAIQFGYCCLVFVVLGLIDSHRTGHWT